MRAIVVSNNLLFQELVRECTRDLDIEIVLHKLDVDICVLANETPSVVILDDTCPEAMSEHMLAELCRLPDCRILLVNLQKDDVIMFCSNQSLLTSSADLKAAILERGPVF